MKLYVWNEPYGVDYGGTILYAVAENIKQAREIALKARVSMFGHNPSRDAPTGEPWFKLGEPDRVLKVPCAEIYHWEE